MADFSRLNSNITLLSSKVDEALKARPDATADQAAVDSAADAIADITKKVQGLIPEPTA